MSDYEMDYEDYGEEFYGDDGMDGDGDIENNQGEDDEEENPEIEMDNQLFEAKSHYKDSEYKDAEKGFKKVLEIQKDKLEGKKTEAGFKAVKGLVKLYHATSKDDEVAKYYTQLLNDYSNLLTEKEKAVTNLLSSLSKYSRVEELFQLTLDKLGTKAAFRLELNQARVFWKNNDWDKLDRILPRLYPSCRLPDGSDDPNKGSQLLEIYAMDISLNSERVNNKKVKELYSKAIAVNGLVNPKMNGIIHEAGGKMHLRELQYQSANTAFIEAFKNYDEGGAKPNAVACLKYLVLANMLSASEIDPFMDKRAKSYIDDKHIAAIKKLIDHYQNKDLPAFEYTIRSNKEALVEDKFLYGYIPGVRRNLHKSIFLDLVKPYSNIKMDFITQQLRLSVEEAEGLIVELILDGEAKAKIDQISGVITILGEGEGNELSRKYESMTKWNRELSGLTKNVLQKVN